MDVLKKASGIAFSLLLSKAMSRDEYYFRISSVLMGLRTRFDWRPEADPFFCAISNDFVDFRANAISEGLDPLEALEKGLDERSVSAIRKHLQRVEAAAEDGKVDARIWYDHDVHAEIDAIRQGIREARERLSIPKHIYPDAFPDIFHFHSGLRFVPSSIVRRYVEDKDVLDCGAYIGDSAIVFSGMYGAKRVHAFEPEPANHRKLLETIRHPGLGDIVPIRAGVGRMDGRARISAMGSSSRIGKDGEEIEMISIDRYVEESGLSPGLIKMDIEGHESEAVMGAIRTIERFRPILLIAIYHNPRDFYGIKRMIEKRVGGYRYMVRHLSYLHPYEVFLIAYPEEEAGEESEAD